MQMLAQEGNLPPGMTGGPQGRGAMGDYVMTQREPRAVLLTLALAHAPEGFDQILEQLMQAAGPQGPLPATDAVIEGLPRFTFNDKTLGELVSVAQIRFVTC